jgi:hypothetical protein
LTQPSDIALLAEAINNLAAAIRDTHQPSTSIPARGLHTALRNSPDIPGRRRYGFGISAHNESETT